jgi:hypothetical protein
LTNKINLKVRSEGIEITTLLRKRINVGINGQHVLIVVVDFGPLLITDTQKINFVSILLTADGSTYNRNTSKPPQTQKW